MTLPEAGIPFNIYERDEHPNARDQGWAITLHWGLAFLRRLLNPEILAAIDDAQVDPDVGRHDTGNFLFLNLATLEPRFRIPPNERRRVGRLRLRQALLSDPRITDRLQWGKRLSDIEVVPDGSSHGDSFARALFRDGSSAEGAALVGVEGANSQTRHFLAPETSKNLPIDVKFVGAAVDMTPAQIKPIRAIDPLLFQGCHPDTNNFLWVSMLESPALNGTEGTPEETYKVQIAVSWPVNTPADREGLDTDAQRAEHMKRRAAEFHPTLRDAVNLVSEKSCPREIPLEDWPCLAWDNRNGRVTLAGDAAHAMVMYRGEGCNHGIMDAFNLVQALQRVYDEGVDLKEAMDDYEREMRDRTSVAVLWSREACIGAHDFHSLNVNSAVLRRRAIKMPVD